MAAGGSEDPARTQLAALRDALRRHGLPAAERIDQVLQGSDEDVQYFLVSDELWGRTGSIVSMSGAAPSWGAQLGRGETFRALGEWQIAHGYATPDVEGWVFFFRSRRGLPPLVSPPAGYVRRAVRPRRIAVPWTVRDVWLGVVVAVVVIGASWGLVYLVNELSVLPNLDLWVAVVPTLFELLFLVPVWWFAVHKRHSSLRSLGFTRFPWRVMAIGIGFFVAYFFVNGLYAELLGGFGLKVQPDLTPLARHLSTLWPLAVTAVFIAPVVEETFFRAFVFGGLRARYDWRWAAAISAALFAAAHLELTFFIPAFALGFLFAYLYQRSDSIWPGMILHMTLNGIAMIALYASL